MKLFILITIAICFLSSCQHSPQKKYYLLTPEMADMTEQQNNNSSSINITSVIGIGPIEIADYLHRPQIVYTPNGDKQSANRLSVSGTDYWAEPLDKGIARVIGLNLTHTNSNRSFVYFPWRSDTKPRYSLRIHISSLTCTNNQATMLADWELVDSNRISNVQSNVQSNMQRRRFSRTLPVSGGAQELSQAYSKLFSELSAEMNKTLSNLQFVSVSE
jgi:uncharacterized protein